MFVTYLNNESGPGSWKLKYGSTSATGHHQLQPRKRSSLLTAYQKNKSGKIKRRVLKARYLGQDAEDISTMED